MLKNCFELGAVLWFAVISSGAWADEPPVRDTAACTTSVKVDGPCRAWTLRVDNDLFTARGEDRDYTAGVSATLIEHEGRAITAPIRRGLRWFDEKTGFDTMSASWLHAKELAVTEFGVILFVPTDLESTDPIATDRPYASLLHLSSSHSTLSIDQTRLRQSTLTIGLLGAPVSAALHRSAHRLFRSELPRGYRHQISDGGELTARYSVAGHTLLRAGRTEGAAYDFKAGVEGSIGYLTEAAATLGLRWGRISSPWWSSVSDHVDYSSQPSLATVGVGGYRDLYLSVGLKLRARAYNAFLQGQFRDSPVTYASPDLHPLISEAWLGVIADVRQVRLSYTLRYQSPELRRGVDADGHRWAGISVTRAFH